MRGKRPFVFELQICTRSKMPNHAACSELPRLHSETDSLARDGLNNSRSITGEKDTISAKTTRDTANRKRVNLNLKTTVCINQFCPDGSSKTIL